MSNRINERKQEYQTLDLRLMLLLFYFLFGFVEGGAGRAVKIRLKCGKEGVTENRYTELKYGTIYCTRWIKENIELV